MFLQCRNYLEHQKQNSNYGYAGLTRRSYTWAIRRTIIRFSGLILTTCISLTCTKISTWCFPFLLPSELWSIKHVQFYCTYIWVCSIVILTFVVLIFIVLRVNLLGSFFVCSWKKNYSNYFLFYKLSHHFTLCLHLLQTHTHTYTRPPTPNHLNLAFHTAQVIADVFFMWHLFLFRTAKQNRLSIDSKVTLEFSCFSKLEPVLALLSYSWPVTRPIVDNIRWTTSGHLRSLRRDIGLEDGKFAKID